MIIRIGQLLQQAHEMLKEGETDSPRLDAEILLSHQLKEERSWLLAHQEEWLEEREAEKYLGRIRERVRGIPVSYLTGEQEFWSLKLKISDQVLIPRPETELLVELGLSCLHSGSGRILDLGTGSGAIALAMASERPEIRVTAVDISTEAIRVAQENADRLQISHVRFLVSDWFSALKGEKFDLMLGNPPYVAEEDEHLLGHIRFEPRESLVAGENGLADIRTIIRSSRSHLVAGGQLMLEHGHDQATAVNRMFQEAGFRGVENHGDLAGLPRVTSGRFDGS